MSDSRIPGTTGWLVAGFGMAISVAGLAIVAAPGCRGRAPEPAEVAKPSSTPTPEAKPTPASAEPQTEQQLLDTGKQLYTRHCAPCHGESGDGNGPAAKYLYPKPRIFQNGKFRLVTTVNRIPSDEDLMRVITRGMPGSAMMPFGHFSELQRKSLVAYVRHLVKTGIEQTLRRQAIETGEQPDPAELAEDVERLTTPGKPLDIPTDVPAADQKMLAQARELYLKECSTCHGKTGKGDGVQEQFDDQGRPIRPRDYTRGIFKGGREFAQLYARTRLGMPGSPMPEYPQLSPQQIAELTVFIQSMSGPEAEQRTLQHQQALSAKKLPADARLDLDSKVWQQVKPTWVALTPLRWRNDRVEGVQVRAVHNGSRLAVYLSWDDPSQNNQAVLVEQFSDGAAIQFSPDPNPPFMAMGDTEGGVNIWYWKADHPAAGKPVAGIDAVFPNMMVSYYPFQKQVQTRPYGSGGGIADQDAIFVAGWGARNPVSDPKAGTAAEDLHATGFGTLAGTSAVRSRVTGQAVWRSGKWHLILSRELAASDPLEVAFSPGQTVSIGFAVWDGQAGDRNGQKQVSIWHKLTLEQ